MKKDLKLFILLAVLLGAQPSAYAQDESLSDEDLQTLLDDKKAPTPEVTEPATKAPAPAEKSSDTVSIEPSATAPSKETPVAPTTPEKTVPEETAKSLDDTLEPLDDQISAEPLPKAEEPKVIAEPEAKPEEKPTEEPKPKTAETPATDDLEDLKKDVAPEKTVEAAKKDEKPEKNVEVFDVGREEHELLAMAQNIQGQISDTEWNEVATAAKVESYTVVKNDWLFKISKRIFGTGFYYPKIWSLNSYITNPHFIEPGMVLSFTTGSASGAPEFKLGAFTDEELNAVPGSAGNVDSGDLANFGENVTPNWMKEKKELSKQGIYFQYASEETDEDLIKAGEQALNREYENYEPPKNDFDVVMPKNYDQTGFDKSSKISYSFKEGFYLNTFVSTNIVQDFGSIVNGPDENIWFTRTNRAFVKFDDTINVLPGDKFSVYSAGGKISHANSDRSGYKFSIVGQVKIIRKVKSLWEVEFIEVSGTPQRGDRITAYTPKIERITRTYNSRIVEAGILGSYQPGQHLVGAGDVVYLDRGRADGLEMGNILEVFGFKDRLLKTDILNQPTYKTGEITIITLTDNFATGLVNRSNRDFYVGDIAITKTKEAHLRELKAKATKANGQKELMGGKALEELDVELNLDDVNDDLLKQADKIQLTEDELAELERQEREKSVIKDSERDLKSLERLENEIESAEKILNDAKLDEDKLLENQNLNDIEKKSGKSDNESLDEIEENLGKRYMDEDLNSKDNPYGLTEFDVEEVDELLNAEKNPVKK